MSSDDWRDEALKTCWNLLKKVKKEFETPMWDLIEDRHELTKENYMLELDRLKDRLKEIT